MFCLAFLVGYSRIHLGVHTLEQVIIGSLIGSGLGWMWGAWAKVCVWTHIFPLIERSKLGQTWYLKDCSLLPSGCQSSHQFEYNCYAQLRAAHVKTKGTAHGKTEKLDAKQTAAEVELKQQ